MSRLEMPALEIILNATDVAPYPYDLSFETSKYKTFALMHTSGSTGLPKKIPVAHGATVCGDGLVKACSRGFPTLLTYLPGKTYLVGLPPFHLGGLWMYTVLAVLCDYVPVWPPLRPITAEVVNDIVTHGEIHACMIAPSIIEDIVNEPKFYDSLGSLEWVFYGGGPLSKDAGDAVARKTSLMPQMGSTELGFLPTALNPRDDWGGYTFAPFVGAEFRHYADDFYEMVVVRKPELEFFQPVFFSFPDLQEFPTKDLYTRHPSRPDTWHYRGRADDVIVFSTGEKINPVEMEGIIGLHPEVNGVVVAGQGRFQSSLLLEPKKYPSSDEEKKNLIEKVWPSIQQANVDCPAHGQLFRDFTTLTSPQKPMSRASKGSIQRLATLKLYESELDQLYETVDMEHEDSAMLDVDLRSHENLYTSLHNIVVELLGTQEVHGDVDLSSIGMDSLKVSIIVRSINRAFRNSKETHRSISPTWIYECSTLESLTTAIMSGEKDGDQDGSILSGEPAGRDSILDSMLKDFCQKLPPRSQKPQLRTSTTILLTGSTGSLGPYLLDSILKDPAVGRIICLARAHETPPLIRQTQLMEQNQLSVDLDPRRVGFHEVELTSPFFGLPEDEYKEMLQSVTHIVHNAWEVNFNLSLKSFVKPHIEGVLSLIRFACQCKHETCFNFISTIGTVMEWPLSHEDNVMPEISLEDWTTVQSTGYAESKAICERLLSRAGQISNLRANICRIGQISGPTTGQSVWNVKEWFPTMVTSSAFTKLLPGDLGSTKWIDFIPVDILAKSLLEVFLHESPDVHTLEDAGHFKRGDSKGTKATVSDTGLSNVKECPEPSDMTKIYHFANPQLRTYESLVPAICQSLPEPVKVVPLEQWVDTLRSTRDEDVRLNPALKLMDFYEHLTRTESKGSGSVILDTRQTCKVSETLSRLGPIRPEWMQAWIKGWDLARSPNIIVQQNSANPRH